MSSLPIQPPPPLGTSSFLTVLHKYFAPSVDNVAIGPNVNIGNGNFSLKAPLIYMVQANPFCGMANEDADAHLPQFLEICNTVSIEGVTQDAI